MRDVFDLLDNIRRRPGMYLRKERPLFELEVLLAGYGTALFNHRLIEPVPDMNRHFCAWLFLRTGWSWKLGWAAAIESHLKRRQDPLEVFFGFVDEYRRLRPTTRCSAVLTQENVSAARRGTGYETRVDEWPYQVEVIQYAPEPLYFFRLHYPDRLEDEDLIERRWALATAKRWAEELFGIQPAQWRRGPGRVRRAGKRG